VPLEAKQLPAPLDFADQIFGTPARLQINTADAVRRKAGKAGSPISANALPAAARSANFVLPSWRISWSILSAFGAFTAAAGLSWS
jgi:hypothetical protein